MTDRTEEELRLACSFFKLTTVPHPKYDYHTDLSVDMCLDQMKIYGVHGVYLLAWQCDEVDGDENLYVDFGGASCTDDSDRWIEFNP